MTDTPEYSSNDVEIDLGEFDSGSDSIEINLDFFANVDETTGEVDVQVDLSEPEEEIVAEPVDLEVDQAIEAALDELRDELRTKPGDWYVVHTYSGMENRVKQNIDSRARTLNMEDFIYETVVPTEDAVELRKGERKQVTRNVLPGYVLVRMELTDDSWQVVRHTPSVTGFVGHANTPVPLSLQEVENMLTPSVEARVAASSPKQSARSKKKIEVVDFAIGEAITVVDGPFSGVHGTITEINTSNQRLKANVEIMGRETPVDLTFTQIKKI